MKKRLQDIYLAVSWREVSRTYFDKSVSWFQQKMYGIDGNGGVDGFTPEEADKLYCTDLSRKAGTSDLYRFAWNRGS